MYDEVEQISKQRLENALRGGMNAGVTFLSLSHNFVAVIDYLLGSTYCSEYADSDATNGFTPWPCPSQLSRTTSGC